MKTRLWMFAAALLLFACDRPCQRMCKGGLREQLILDFGVLPQSVNCDDEKWLVPENCAECSAMLERVYAVMPTSCRDDAFAEPVSR